MKFWFCLGTAAELIKIFPIIAEAEERNIEWFVISTGQSGLNFYKQYKDFNLPEERLISLQKTHSDLANSKMALKWFLKSFFISSKKIRNIIELQSGTVFGTNDFWFIHGDTLSTLIASFYGRRLKIPSVHIEAGMRSGHLMAPFPEEICRRIVSRLSVYHMAPDLNAEKNLKAEGVTKNVFVTNGNTVMDTLTIAIKRFKPVDLPESNFAIANIHRFENLNSDIRWNKIIDIILKANQKIPIIFILMPNTEEKIENDLNLKLKLKQANIQLVRRLPFSRFVHLMNNAEFMLTDGGSNQQECFHLGKPCLILREHSESLEGIGSCCVVSKFKDEIINQFLENPSNYKASTIHQENRATTLIFEALQIPDKF